MFPGSCGFFLAQTQTKAIGSMTEYLRSTSLWIVFLKGLIICGRKHRWDCTPCHIFCSIVCAHHEQTALCAGCDSSSAMIFFFFPQNDLSFCLPFAILHHVRDQNTENAPVAASKRSERCHVIFLNQAHLHITIPIHKIGVKRPPRWQRDAVGNCAQRWEIDKYRVWALRSVC